MSEKCLKDDCKICDYSVVRAGKLDCNYANRLGLGKSDLGAYMGKKEEEE